MTLTLTHIAIAVAAGWSVSIGVAYLAGQVTGFGRAERLVRQARE